MPDFSYHFWGDYCFRVPGKLKQFVLDLHSGKLHREFHHGPDPTDVAPGQVRKHMFCHIMTEWDMKCTVSITPELSVPQYPDTKSVFTQYRLGGPEGIVHLEKKVQTWK